MTDIYKVDGMHCPSCPMLIEDILEDVPGVTEAEASLKAGTVSVEHDGSVSATTVLAAISEGGYTAAPA